ncbi:hypothetical protein MRX96_057393, partial [Rhipicephalus microplus]
IPYYNGSFVASGEFQRTNFKVSGISHPYELSVFEEAYDSIEKRAAFRVTKKGDVMTYIQDLRSKRSYLIRTYGGTTTCEKVPNANFTRKQFMTVVSAPDERMYFFLRDLLVLRSGAIDINPEVAPAGLQALEKHFVKGTDHNFFGKGRLGVQHLAITSVLREKYH